MPSLFDRVPPLTFAPLAAPRHDQYWDLLVHLYDARFGPDATPAEGDGFSQRAITMEIEKFLAGITLASVDDALDTPLNIRANTDYRYLVDTGWLREDRIGVKRFVSMPTGLQRMLELLRQFAEEGPQHIGGKVQIIFNQLERAQADPAREAGGFHEAALQARQLINALNATTMHVREVDEFLSSQDSTPAFVRVFFDNYIGKVYIGDYHSLRTENHPLQHRMRVVQVAMELRDDPIKRGAMISYYREAFRCMTDDEAAVRFERDVSRFLMFRDIDRHLDRLNASVDRATARALSRLRYKLRTQDTLDKLIGATLRRLGGPDTGGAGGPALGLLPGPFLGEQRLPTAHRKTLRPERTPIKRQAPSKEQMAMIRLRWAIKRSRTVSPTDIGAYIERHLGDKPVVTSDDLAIQTIHDLCTFVAARRIALRATATTRSGRTPPSRFDEYRFDFPPNEVTENPYLRLPRFRISRRTP